MFGGAEIPDFKTLDSHVTFVLNCKYALSAGGSEMRGVEDGRLARIALKSNESISRVAGYLDGYEFFVDPAPHVDGTTRTHGIGGVLNSAPRCSLGAGIRITPTRRHVEGRVRLAESKGNTEE